MHAVLNSALPIFALILTGFICGYFGVFDRVATDNLNRFAVYLALPSLMFVAMSKITPDQVRQFGFIGAFVGGIAVCFAVAFIISRHRGCAKGKQREQNQEMFHGGPHRRRV
jgi:hypothetical protein